VVPGEPWPRMKESSDPATRNIALEPYSLANEHGFTTIGDLFSTEKNPGRKKPFDVRAVMRAVMDKDEPVLERWAAFRRAETAIIWDTHLGGHAVSLIGIDAQQNIRLGWVPADGPDAWAGSTLYPLSSK